MIGPTDIHRSSLLNSKTLKTLLVSFRCSGFVWLSDLTGIIFLYKLNQPFFVDTANCVHCEVRTESLCKQSGRQAGSSVDYHLTGFSRRTDLQNWGFLWVPLALPVIFLFCALRDHGVPPTLCTVYYSLSVPGSSVGIATDYGLYGPASNPGGDEIFRPSRPSLRPT